VSPLPTHNHAPPLPPHCVALGKGGLLHLRNTLLASQSPDATAQLQGAGAAAGSELFQAFCAWLPGYAGVNRPEDLDASRLDDILGAFFRNAGWGSLTMAPLGGMVLAFDSNDWVEASPGADLGVPSCYLTTGLLTSFLTALSDAPVAVMEVECRSKNDGRCRFLSGSPETLQSLYDQLLAGRAYQQALGL
jgi:V4R domain-containing protein